MKMKAEEEFKDYHKLCEIPYEMSVLLEHEGFRTKWYMDDKKNSTIGVGQTGEYSTMPFFEVYIRFIDKAKRLTPKYDDFPKEVRAAILSATYRGDWGGSPVTRELFNKGFYAGAAKEFLRNEDYLERKKKGNDGVVKRMEWIANTIRGMV